MFGNQFSFTDLRVTLVTTIHCSAIGEEMFRSGRNVLWFQWRTGDQTALQTKCHRACICSDKRWVR